MTKPQRRGGLGRGLGALIPTAPPRTAHGDSSPEPTDAVMSGDDHDADGMTATQPQAPSLPGNGVKTVNRVPSLSALSASSATDFYFDPAPVPGTTLRQLRPDQITTNPRQPRQVFDEDALAELSHSIKEFGVLQPIVVRAQGAGFELVMGERRLRAAIAAGLERIPAIVRDTADDAMLRDALLENIHRAQLNPLEEAAAYQQLLQEFGVTHEELASKIGRSRSQVSNTIRLLNLSVPVQRRVAAGVLSAGHARALLGLEDRDQQDDLASRIVAEGLSVRATEELVTLAASGSAAKARAKPARRPTAPALGELANKLSDTLETRVKVELGRRKGKITVEFSSIDDLERIVAVIAPQLATTAAADRPS
ncbi:MAG: ParB family transcriptional regulator, chromosome partitioning protein [Pseudonocardiales bacterium]|nr:ParB family transcriptional regulator, chromosome partitioning protein [Pseudonocardiales bacterium]